MPCVPLPQPLPRPPPRPPPRPHSCGASCMQAMDDVDPLAVPGHLELSGFLDSGAHGPGVRDDMEDCVLAQMYSPGSQVCFSG